MDVVISAFILGSKATSLCAAGVGNAVGRKRWTTRRPRREKMEMTFAELEESSNEDDDNDDDRV